ncbi:MAG TPA: alpha/beta hydrolase [Candidatus Nitrosopolaris sp.]|nr:alpha/beta hydrolase [Candidatus Nitrosopolaris sp.]
MKHQVICVPGSVAPAAQRYGALLAGAGDAADLYLKDLEVYRESMPPVDYSVEMEVTGLDRFADSHGLDQFHLVGYSGGGFVSLAYAATRPNRLLSLGLFEPAGIPGNRTDQEQAAHRSLQEQLRGLDGADFMSKFVRLQLKPGVPPPPAPASVPAEMRNRPAGISAMIGAFDTYHLDRELFKACSCPVYVGYGDLSDDYQLIKVQVLAGLFGDIHVQRYAGIHHFVSPEEIYTPAHARDLLGLWRRADARLASELALE